MPSVKQELVSDPLLTQQQPAPQQTVEAPAPQRAPLLARASEGMPDAGVHAGLLSRLTSAGPARVGPLAQRLQRQYGNQYVGRLVARVHEAEADAGFGGEPYEVVDGLEEAINQARGGGQGLDNHTQAQMETAFGASFRGVRVHTDAQADDMSSALSARAFTVGQDIFFKRDEYAPGTSGGRELLAHELTHVVQQTGDGIQTKLTVSEPGDRYEQEADAMAQAVMRWEQQGDGERMRSTLDHRLDLGARGVLMGKTAVTASSYGREAGRRLQCRYGNDYVMRAAQARAEARAAEAAPSPDARSADADGVESNTAIVDANGGGGIPAPAPAVTPPAPAPPVSPPVPAPPVAPALAVTLPAHIRGSATPASMAADRIPPRVDTPVAVTVNGWGVPMLPITLEIAGAGGGNGTATINGAATHDVTSSGTVQLRGNTQTSPGNGGRLQLVARQGGTELARSGTFSISSIPQNWNVTFQSLVNDPGLRGMRVTNAWESDSGNLADLDQAQRSESVETKSASGCFNMAPSIVSGYRPATSGALTDTHGMPVAVMTSPGTRVSQQTFKFRDNRTGAVDIPARRSGYSIRRVVTAVGGGGGGFQLQTTKAGAAGTANGITSEAGAGNADSGLQPI